MHPVLCDIGPLTLYTFGIALALAFLIGTWMAQHTMARARALGAAVTLTSLQVTDLVFWLLVSGVLGARVIYVASHLSYYAAAPWEALAIWQGGLIFYGGFGAALAGGWWYLRRQHIPVLPIMDLFMPTLGIGHAIGRIGCFLNGCCYGKPTHALWGVTFPWSPEPRHPTQLLEAAFTAALAVMCYWWLLRRRVWTHPPHGRVALAYVTLYAVWRFGLEFLRGDNPSLAWGLNFPQWVSIAIVAAAALAWLRLQRRA